MREKCAPFAYRVCVSLLQAAVGEHTFMNLSRKLEWCWQVATAMSGAPDTVGNMRSGGESPPLPALERMAEHGEAPRSIDMTDQQRPLLGVVPTQLDPPLSSRAADAAAEVAGLMRRLSADVGLPARDRAHYQRQADRYATQSRLQTAGRPVRPARQLAG